MDWWIWLVVWVVSVPIGYVLIKRSKPKMEHLPQWTKGDRAFVMFVACVGGPLSIGVGLIGLAIRRFASNDDSASW